MSSDPESIQLGAIWQGFNHAWEYNHRLNRLGSYVRLSPESDDEPVVGHTAASGTGGDIARFSEYVTVMETRDVAFQAGCAETTVECPRAVTTRFRIKLDPLELAPDLVGKQTYTILINGFDLAAQRHADKLIAFDLEISEPVIHADGRSLRFNIFGDLCLDCRTAECQLWPLSLEVERVSRRGAEPGELAAGRLPKKRGIPNRPAFGPGVNWLKRQIARLTDLENVKRGIVGRDEERLRRRLFRLFGRQFFVRLAKWRILSPYRLRVHYLIIGADRQDLRVTDSGVVQNTYSWDAETEIHREELGSARFSVAGDDPQRYELNTFGFKQLSVATEMDHDFGSTNPIQWGKGMHLLEWHTAVRDIEAVGNEVSGTLDLFYKSWSEAMNEVITFTTWGAVRSAGTASLAARLALLQFKGAAPAAQRSIPGQLYWPGGGLNAREDPRAISERPMGSLDEKGFDTDEA